LIGYLKRIFNIHFLKKTVQIYVFFAFLEQNKNIFFCEIKKKNERLSICQVDFSNMIVLKK